MSDGNQFNELLRDPALALRVSAADAVGLLDALAAHEGRCRLLRDLLTRRVGRAEPEERDELLDIAETAALLNRSVSWLRHHGQRLPGFRQPGGKGTRSRWSRAALVAWQRDAC